MMSVVTDTPAQAPGSGRPRPLGRDFTRLWSAAAFSNLADGLGRTAVPLIATTLTRDPLLISLLGAAAFVPWLVFGVVSPIPSVMTEVVGCGGGALSAWAAGLGRIVGAISFAGMTRVSPFGSMMLT